MKFGSIFFQILCLFFISLVSYSQKNILNSVENIDSLGNSVSYEQRFDRNPFRVWSQLQTSKYGHLSLVTKFQGVPLASYRVEENKIILEEIAKTSLRNKLWIFPFYKLDIQVLPELRTLFGFRTDPVRIKLGGILQTSIPLFRGFVLTGGIYLPVKNELDDQPLTIRPSPIYINKFAKIGAANFLSLSAGMFYNDCYGLNFQYQHQNFKSLFTYGFETSLSGKYYYYPEIFKYTKAEQFLFLANSSYRFRKKDMLLKLSAGQFLYDDRGVKIEMINQFRKAEIAFFGVSTQNGSTLGIKVSFRIWPGSIVETSKFRIRTPDDFSYNYIYTSGYKIGENYRVGYNLDEKLRQYHQSYWNNALTKKK